MHASGDHLVGNMFMLFILGMACEHAFGWQAFLFLYVSACITGSFLHDSSQACPPWAPRERSSGWPGAIISMMYVNRKRIELRDHRVGIVLAIWSIYTLVLAASARSSQTPATWEGWSAASSSAQYLPPALLTERDELARRPATRLQTALALGILATTAILFVPHLR